MGALPDSIELRGRRVPILTDFRAVLRWYTAVSGAVFLREGRGEAGRLLAAMLCLEALEPEAADEAALELCRFLLCGEEPEAGESGEPVIDYARDWLRIWAAFRSRYGIDLDRERMHWWRFRALLDELPEDCRLVGIMRLRAEPPRFPGEGAGAEAMERYRRALALRERYAIKRE